MTTEQMMPWMLGAGVLVGAFIVVMLIFSRLYKRASKERAFVRTGFGGQKIVMNGGAMVLPVIQETIEVNMNTMRLNVARSNEAGLITKDRMRVDVQAEFFVRVKPTEDAIADAAQTLGNRTMQPEKLKELVEGKFVDALRSVAAELTMEELHEKRGEFVQRVQTTVSEDILKNGLELESVSLTALDQTSQEFLNPQNAFDAQGLAKLTEIIEAKRKQRNDIEQETRVQIELKNLDAEKQSLNLQQEQQFVRLAQEREVAMRRAQQEAEIAKEQATRSQEARQAEVQAQQLVQQTEIEAKRKVEEKRIDLERAVAEQEVQKQRAVEATEIDKAKTLELAEQDRAIAEKSKAKSEAEALAAAARAEAVRAEERVITAKELETAERRKSIELVLASEEAEREAIKIKVAATAEKAAALDQAEAIQTIAEADASRARLQAQGEAEAEKLRAEAMEKTLEVEAEGKRKINEADNLLNASILEARIKQILIENLPNIIRESVKPMEQIEGIKIIQVEGLGGGGAGSAPGSGNEGSLADQLVNSALRYRGQAPLVDSLMHEIGLKGGDLNSLTNGLVASTNGTLVEEKPKVEEHKSAPKTDGKPKPTENSEK